MYHKVGSKNRAGGFPGYTVWLAAPIATLAW